MDLLVHNVCRIAKKEQLPTQGKIRFIPKNNKKLEIVKIGDKTGYKDKFANIWIKGPSRTKGEAFEWDVQLSRKGKEMLGRFSRDGRHLNVSLKGRITHK